MTAAKLIIYVALFGIALAAGETEKKENENLFHAGLPAAHANFVHRPISEVDLHTGSRPHADDFPLEPLPKPTPANPDKIMHAGLPSAHANFVHRPAIMVEQEHQASLLAKNNGPSSLDDPVVPVPPTPPEALAENIHSLGLPSAHANFVHRPAIMVEQEHQASLLAKNNGPSSLDGPVAVPVPPTPPEALAENIHSLGMTAKGAQDNIHVMPINPASPAIQTTSKGSTEDQLRILGVQPGRGDPRHPMAQDFGEGMNPGLLPPHFNDAEASLHHGAIASPADNLPAHHMLPEEARAYFLAHPLPSSLDRASSNSVSDRFSMELATRNGLPINRHDLPNPNRPVSGGVLAASSGAARHFPSVEQMANFLPVEQANLRESAWPQDRSLVEFGRGFLPPADRSHMTLPVVPKKPVKPTDINSNTLSTNSAPRNLDDDLPNEIPPPPLPPLPSHEPPYFPHSPEEMHNHLTASHNMMGGPPAFPESHLAHRLPDSTAGDFTGSPPAHFQAAFGRGKAPEEIPLPMLPHNIPNNNMNPHQMTPAFDSFVRGFLRGSMPDKVAVIPSTTTTEEERKLSANPPPNSASSSTAAAA